MQYYVELTGETTIEVTALGPGDAEHQLEKIAHERCAEARIDILAIRRTAAEARLAEHYTIRCRIRVALVVEADSRLVARRAALRRTRERFAGTGFWSVQWGEPKLREGNHPDLPHQQDATFET